MLSCIVGQLHAFAPFLVDVHLALRQFHYNVGGLESGIIRQIGADAEGAADFAPAMLLDVECLAKIERIAEDDGFSGRVDTQFAVAATSLSVKSNSSPESQRTPSNSLACLRLRLLKKMPEV